MSGNRWRIIVLLMGYAALGHFNRLSITVAGDEMFIPKMGINFHLVPKTAQISDPICPLAL